MQPTTEGRFRVLDERADEATFVLVELPDEPGPVDPAEPDAEAAYDRVHVDAEGYADEVGATVAALQPGYVVAATLAWDDGDARFEAVEVERETRIEVADDVTGMFDAATEAWQAARANGEAMTSLTTRGQDGDPNGALYCFADPPGRDLLADLRDGTVPLEPLIARVNARLDDDRPRAVFLMRPEAYDYVAVYVVFARDGVLASTIRDTYDIRSGLVDQLGAAGEDAGVYGDDP
mgnify:CR=1 FL=1